MPRPAPERTCLVTGEVRAKDDLLRFVVTPDRALMHDITGKLPGRGIYVSLKTGMIAEAIERKLFKRAAKQPITIEDDLESLVHAHLKQRVLEGISLARKAGAAVSGYDKCKQALQAEEVVCMLHASDASEDGVRKLTRADAGFPVVGWFDREALSQVMGGENVVHVAVLKGQGSAFFMKQLRRFALFIEKTPL